MNDSQDPVTNNHGNNHNTKDATFINLSNQEMMLPKVTHGLPIINLGEFLTTPTHGNTRVKRKHSSIFHMSLNLPIKITRL